MICIIPRIMDVSQPDMQVSIAKFPLGKQPQPVLLAGAAPVQVGPVQVGGDLVHLLTQDQRDDLDLDDL